jgi:hypothetical protein
MSVMMVMGVLLGTQAAWADDCSISGTITASPTNSPGGPAWAYTLVMTWDTGTPYALSHANVLIDSADGTCMCSDLEDALSWNNPIGTSDGDPNGCIVSYEGFLECKGDPSIPGVEGILLKLEPIEDEFCEPGPTGTGTFVFYSDLPPAPIDEDILSIVDKYATQSCFGHLSGDFPGLACDPVSVDGASWGTLKGLFR